VECDNASDSADTTIGFGLNFLALVEVASLFVEVAVIRVCLCSYVGRHRKGVLERVNVLNACPFWNVLRASIVVASV